MKKEKRCPRCEKTLPIDEYYIIHKLNPKGERITKPNTYCKKCVAKLRKESYNRTKKNKKEDGLTISYAYNLPGTYLNNKVKDDVFTFLRNCGWEYNEENCMWYKEGLKSPTGEWNIPKKPKKIEPPTPKIIQNELPTDIKEQIIYYHNKGIRPDSIYYKLKQKETLTNIKEEIQQYIILNLNHDFLNEIEDDEDRIMYLYDKGLAAKYINRYVECALTKIYQTINEYK